MKSFLTVMKALSDANRIKIVKLLQRKAMCVCEIRELLHIAQPSVSKHLKVLEQAGLVNSKKEGQWVNYFLADGRDSAYAATLLGSLRHWLEDDSEIAAMVDRLPHIDRETICQR